MNHLLDPQVFSNAAEWPRCPKCGSRDVLAANVRQYCLSCSARSPLADLRGQAGAYALAASLLQHPDQLAPAVQFGPFPQRPDSEFGHILHARRVEALLDGALDPLIDKARQYFQRRREFPSVGLRFKTLLSRPDVVDLSTAGMDELIERGRESARGADAYADLFLMDSCHGGLTGPALGVYFECYGAPGSYHSIPLSPQSSPDESYLTPGRSYLYQPIYWNDLIVDPAHETIHYAAGFEARGSSNASFAITENLNYGEIVVHTAFREPGDPEPRSKKRTVFPTTEEAVAATRARFKKLVDMIEPDAQVFSFEREFGMERNYLGILGELMQLEIWEVYAKERSVEGESSYES
jgi:hypothetical protein